MKIILKKNLYKLKSLSIFFLIFSYLFICFKWNIYSFENFISFTEELHTYGFKDIIKWELDFFSSNFNQYITLNDHLHTQGNKFINFYPIKFLQILGFKSLDYKYYYYLIVNIYIFLFSFFFGIILLKFGQHYSYASSLLLTIFLSFTIPLYIYLRAPTLIAPILFCFISVVILSMFKFNKFFYFLITITIFFICLYFSPAMFFIYISVLLIPYLIKDGEIRFSNFFKTSSAQFFILIVIAIILYFWVSQNLYLKSDIDFINQLVIPKIEYYIFAFNNCESFKLYCYVGTLIGESRVLWDTFYTFLPFFYAADNPWDGTINKEIRLFSPLNLTIIILIFSNFLNKNKNLILRNCCIVSFLSFGMYFMLFPYQIITYQYSPAWLIYPYYILLLTYLSWMIGTFTRLHNFIFIIFSMFYCISIYRFLTLDSVKFLNF